jgi:hypothetical protein
MQKDNLIKLYDHVCNKYKEQLRWEVQRFSNNSSQSGIITDEELITIYLFCVMYEERFKIKSMYNYIKTHWQSWFPLLPSYQAFNARLNHICEAFGVLLIDCMSRVHVSSDNLKILLGDSYPIITCSHKRKGKVARDMVNKGYCATKKLHYYGVKLHALGIRREGSIPIPQYIEVTAANVHDLTASKEILQKIKADVCVLDKAYADITLAEQMKMNNNILLTPIKNKKGLDILLQQIDSAYHDLFNKAVSSVRQPIESLFNWIHEKTNIQIASKVRSSNGLKLHIYGKMTAALLLLINF